MDGMGSAVENALGALDVDAILAQAANAVVTGTSRTSPRRR